MGESPVPNVVWVTVESTRADHTSVGSATNRAGRDTTPGLRARARRDDGRSFGACHAHGIYTLPSSASILTGTVASHHGVGMGSERLPADIPTVAERFAEAGYRTAALSTVGHVSSATGLDRGFDRFAWLTASTALDVAGPATALTYGANLRRHSAGFTASLNRHRTGYLVSEVAKRWVDDAASDDPPLFLYVHYGDPHFPYVPPLPYLRAYADEFPLSPAAAYDLAEYHGRHILDLIAGDVPLSAAERETLSALYDACIAYADDRVTALLDHAERTLGPTASVVTADHGDLFGERGTVGHRMTVHGGLSNVPLVTTGLDAALSYGGDLIQHVDVVRALLARAGADTSGLHGVDVRETEREHALVQRGERRFAANLAKLRERRPAYRNDRYLAGTEHALFTDEFAYRRGDDRSELLRLPDEERDVSAADPERAAALDAALDDLLATDGVPFDGERREGSYTPEMRTHLRSLGYL
ncbi:sulfatase-like hydrolase/transferase [Candidatus Halobonum tyrrellensis]|uniref:Sulfatase n=1 Tax=Candidatus Halobonum tyrrellensis G22 TaxID=1324957 RepID=V4GNE6_9EURY|nr:sulfatase-like hydrolase/transferase [Candidatus Halobonum tyrrellensis]ESP86921.1 sulfatase [Candidatus Halobonum tyrrellensis G22]